MLISGATNVTRGWFFVILSIMFLISVKFCSIVSINVDALEVLIISRIDKSPTQSLWVVEIQSGQQGNLTDIKNIIDKITKNQQQSMSEICQQRQMFQDQIKQMRVKINSHLDTLEQNILQEHTIFVICRNTIWTASFVMVLTKMCIFHIMIFTLITDF
jgi:hypothetical protein